MKKEHTMKKLFTLPERKILKFLFLNSASLEEIEQHLNLNTQMTFKILQKLTTNKFIINNDDHFEINSSYKESLINTFKDIETKKIEISEILSTALDESIKNPASVDLKVKEVYCTEYDLKIIKHYFSEIERFLTQLKENEKKITQQKIKAQKMYIFFGEHEEKKHWEKIKNKFMAQI